MVSQNFSEDRIAKYVVTSVAIVALVVVTYFDLSSESVRVPDVVYWILGGAVLGAENLIGIIRK